MHKHKQLAIGYYKQLAIGYYKQLAIVIITFWITVTIWTCSLRFVNQPNPNHNPNPNPFFCFQPLLNFSKDWKQKIFCVIISKYWNDALVNVFLRRHMYNQSRL